MKINYEFTMDDWMAFHKHHLLHSRQYKRMKYFFVLLIPIISIVFAFINYINSNPINITSFILPLLWLILMPKISDYIQMRSFKWLMGEGANKAYLGQHFIEFEEDYFVVTAPGFETKVKWPTLSKVEENKDYIFIYLSSISAYVIPKLRIDIQPEKIMSYIKERITQPNE